MEQQRERTRAFLLLTMPQLYTSDRGCVTTLSTSTRSGRTGWLLSVFRSLCSIIWTLQPGQAIPLSVRLWKSICLQPISASLNPPLRSLYTTTVRGKAEGRLSERENRLLSNIIVSLALRLTSGTDLYRCYGQLCQYIGVLSPYMLLYVPLCHSYAALYRLRTPQTAKLRCVRRDVVPHIVLNLLVERKTKDDDPPQSTKRWKGADKVTPIRLRRTK
jgi:hypothetical protein